MRKIKLLAVAALLAVGTSASAQFTNTSSKSARTASTDGWSTIYVQYNPTKIGIDQKGADDMSLNAFSIGYNKAFSISKSLPFFVEAGIGLQYMFKTDEEPYEDYPEVNDRNIQPTADKYNVFSAKIPVSLAYCWSIPNSKVALIPFAGIDFRINISGKVKTEYEMGEDVEDYYEGNEGFWEEYYGLQESRSLFDEDDMGDEDYTWKRFQIGWHIGVNARFNGNLLLGVSYGTDFSELFKKAKMKTTSVTLGYCF